MANIRRVDMRLIEDAFGMASGYVLDFTNRSFEQFFRAERTSTSITCATRSEGRRRPNACACSLRSRPI